MHRAWRYLAHDPSRVRQLSSDLHVSPLVAQVLIARGLRDEAEEFLNARLTGLHDPELLPGVADAADRIVSAIRSQRRVTIYGDYDVDGVTATALLWHCIKLAGGRVDFYIPSRLEEGYGLNCDALRQLHQEDPQRLLISVDCGIGSIAEAALARELGLELIITDHHQVGAVLPDACCLVHPRLPGTSYPFGELCGVGVALKLAWGICQRLGDGKKASPQMRNFLMGAVGLAAIGTVADVVPLRGENRLLVKYGLKSLLELATPGLKALLHVVQLGQHSTIDSDQIAFALAPRINAAGRLGQARLAVELLTTENADRAAALASYLDQLNKSRRTVEQRIFKEARELMASRPEWHEDPALILHCEDWHPGVIGIVASRVAEHFARPAILIAVNSQASIGQGSGRSHGGFDLHAALCACETHLISYGGHQAAAGLKIAPDRIDAFRQDFCRYVGQNHARATGLAELRIDAEVRLCDVTSRAVQELDRLSPFGHENPRPVFATSRVELAEPPRKMGEGERHLSLRVRNHNTTLRAVAFSRAEWADPIAGLGAPIFDQLCPLHQSLSRERKRGASIDRLAARCRGDDIRANGDRIRLTTTSELRHQLREELEARGITDPRVLDVMEHTPRDLFVPESLRHAAYDDSALPIGNGQTISQPYIVALMSHELRLAGDENVLEIGTGSGYQTAILARLCQKVVTIERIAALAESARRVFAELSIHNVVFRIGDGTLGEPDQGPYDRIIVTASAPSVPEPLYEQLKPGGRLIAPVGDESMQELVLVEKTGSGRKTTPLCGCRFVKLIGEAGWNAV